MAEVKESKAKDIEAKDIEAKDIEAKDIEAKAETKTVFLPRASETEQQFEFVCINGKAYQVPRGKPVEVPLAVAEVLEHAQMQETELFERVNEMQQK
jgi:hypothetical protein